MKHSRWLVAAVLSSVVMGFGLPARAQEAGPAAPTVEQRLNDLEQEIRVLKRQRELEREKTAEKAPAQAVVTAGADGFALRSADGAFQLKLRGYVQTDGRFYLDDGSKKVSNTFLVRRARPILEGTLYRDFSFRLNADFGGGSTVLYDAYGEWKHWPWLAIRGGKLKPPVGLERLQSDADQLFAEAGFTTALVPNRDIGIQVGGDLFGGVVNYAVGVFNGVPDGSATVDLDAGDEKDLAARIFVQPFKKTDWEPVRGLGVGVAGTYGKQEVTSSTTNLPSFKTAGQQTFFSYRSAAYPDGARTRVVPQAYYCWGPFGLLAEYAISAQRVRNGTTTEQVRNQAWQVAASYLLTGDNATYTGVNPKHPFNLGKGDWGAFELVARYGVLDVDNDAFAGGAASLADPAKSASRAAAWGLGLNWYLNRNVRLDLDYEQTAFDGGAGATGAVTDRPDEKVIFSRVQLQF